jgi:hypothetical protein
MVSIPAPLVSALSIQGVSPTMTGARPSVSWNAPSRVRTRPAFLGTSNGSRTKNARAVARKVGSRAAIRAMIALISAITWASVSPGIVLRSIWSVHLGA